MNRREAMKRMAGGAAAVAAGGALVKADVFEPAPATGTFGDEGSPLPADVEVWERIPSPEPLFTGNPMLNEADSLEVTIQNVVTREQSGKIRAVLTGVTERSVVLFEGDRWGHGLIFDVELYAVRPGFIPAGARNDLIPALAFDRKIDPDEAYVGRREAMRRRRADEARGVRTWPSRPAGRRFGTEYEGTYPESMG